MRAALAFVAFPLLLLGFIAMRRIGDVPADGDYSGEFGDDFYAPDPAANGFDGAAWPSFDWSWTSGGDVPAPTFVSGGGLFGDDAPAAPSQPVYNRSDIFGALTPDPIADEPTIQLADAPTGDDMSDTIADIFNGSGGNAEKIKGLLASQGGPVANVDAFEPFVMEACGTYGVRPEIVRAMIYRESRYKPNAKNPNSSALGLMQVVRGTAAEMGFDYVSLVDPRTGILCGTKYLAQQIAEFGEVDGVRAYYAGPGNVRKEKRYGISSTVLAEADRYAQGVFANV